VDRQRWSSLFALYACYDFTQKLTTIQIPSSAQVALKGALGEAIFNREQKAEVVPADQLKGKTGLDALLSPVPAGRGQGLIDAYQKDPQKFKRYADMLDTAMNAKQVADVFYTQAGHTHRTVASLCRWRPNLKLMLGEVRSASYLLVRNWLS
jgi:hypothetical protein